MATTADKPTADRWEQLRRDEIGLWLNDRRKELKLDLGKYWSLAVAGMACVLAASWGAGAAAGALWGAVVAAAGAALLVGRILTRWLRIECSHLERRLNEIEDRIRYDLRGQYNDLEHQVQILQWALDYPDTHLRWKRAELDLLLKEVGLVVVDAVEGRRPINELAALLETKRPGIVAALMDAMAPRG